MSADFQLRPDRDLTVLIPARAGSKRVPGKNTRRLAGTPLVHRAVKSALEAHPAAVIVSTDDNAIVLGYGIFETGVLVHHRKPEHATDTSPDIDWVLDVLPNVTTLYIAICRPTSPFRTASTIRRGYAAFLASGADSIRAVEKVAHPHPAKMWLWDAHEQWMTPVLAGRSRDGTPYHSMPTQALPIIYKQNASLEIARVDRVRETKTISGTTIAPFFTEPLEGFDINTEEDFLEAERLASQREGA